MINDENKELLFRTILAIVLLIAVLILGIYFIFSIKNKNKEDETPKIPSIPQIKEDFESTTLNSYRKYNNKISLNDNNEIILSSNDENISHYVIGKFGSIFNSMLPSYIIKEKVKYKNYEVIYKDNYFYYIDLKNNIISDNYKNITPLKRNNEYSYLILYNDNQYYLLNLETDELKELDSNIISIEYTDEHNINNNNFINNNDYLVVINKDKKYGLIDYTGNIIIDFKYDYLKTYINNNSFIAKINNKYGIINDKQEIVIDFENDNILYFYDLNKYSIFIKNNKLGIYYNDKLVVNYKLDYPFNNENAISYIVNNDNLYLTVLSGLYDETVNYIIDKNGIQNTSKTTFEPLIDNNNELKFFYTIEEINNESKITYYDLDYNSLYTIQVPYKNTNDDFIIIDLIKDNISSIKYTSKKEIFYIDLFNSKQLKEIDVLYTYFDNGYSYTLNANKELKIYKNNEIISMYDNIDKYLGGYYFLSVNYNEKDDCYSSNIYNIEFQKEKN